MFEQKNPLNIPTLENNELQKLEWGPELGSLSWHDAEDKIKELNKNLEQEEKPWRLPTNEELLAEFRITSSAPSNFNNQYYWSSTEYKLTNPDTSRSNAYYIDMHSGNTIVADKNNDVNSSVCARLIR